MSENKPKIDANITGMNMENGGLNLELEGSTVKALAESYVDFFKGRDAKNYVEVGFYHDDVGRMTVTLQKQEGITPCEKIAKLQAALRQVREYVEPNQTHNKLRAIEVIDEALAV